MDPVTALGVAAAAVQFVDFTTKLITTSRDIYVSSSGELHEISEKRSIATNLLALNKELKKPINGSGPPLTLNEQALLELCDECSHISEELLRTLNKLKPKGDKITRWDSFRHALRTIWGKEEIDALQKRMESMREQLVMNVLVSLRDQVTKSTDQQANIGTQMTTLVSSNRYVGRRFLKHIDESERWRDDLIRAIRENPQIPADLQSTTVDVVRFQKRIHALLRFPEIENRRDRIPDAFKRTFEWIYRGPEADQKPWTNFIEWLGNGQSLYWITGKAGAGKSTLMKLVHRDPRTREHLQRWASPDPLVMAAFFFWNSGSKLEMSREGLLRSLLCTSLDQCPELSAACFPELWGVYEIFGTEPQSIQWSDLLRALRRMVEAGMPRKFFFLVDGLDEFDGDHSELIALVKQLADFPNVKICVSSRPWNVFEDAFKSGPSLLLQDLTHPDFIQYITTSFAENPGYTELAREDPQFARDLVNGIARKASGIFLWVSLVVRSLLIGLTDGDRIIDLQKRLDSLPPDLEGLFRKMLDNLDPLYLQHASQLFQIYRAARVAPTLLCLAFADEPDPRRVFRFPTRRLTLPELYSVSERMRRRLNSRCKGLLEIAGQDDEDEEDTLADALRKISVIAETEDDFDENALPPDLDVAKVRELAQSKVEYLHRTVRDFITRDDVWAEIKAAAPSFNPCVSLCRAHLYLFKASGLKLSDLQSHNLTITMRVEIVDAHIWDPFTWCVQYAVDSEKRTGDFPIDVLDELGRVAGVCTPTRSAHIGLFRGSGKCWCTAPADEATGALLPLAVALQLTSYLKAKLPRSPALKANQQQKSLLHVAVEDYQTFASTASDRPDCAHQTPSEEVIRLLLENGADPNEAWPDLPSPWETAVKKRCSKEVIECFLKHGADRRLFKQHSQQYKESTRERLRRTFGGLVDAQPAGEGEEAKADQDQVTSDEESGGEIEYTTPIRRAVSPHPFHLDSLEDLTSLDETASPGTGQGSTMSGRKEKKSRLSWLPWRRKERGSS